MPLHLIPDPNAPGDFQSPATQPQLMRNRFRVPEAGHNLDAIRWWRQIGTDPAPLNLRLYDLTAERIVAELPAPAPALGFVGWVRVELPASEPLDPTHTYAVADIVTQGRSAGVSYAPWAPDPPIEFVGADLSNDLTSPTPPTTSQTWEWAIDAVLDDPAPPAGGGTLDQGLASWLSNDPPVQEHEADGLPWLRGLDVQAILQNLGNVTDQDVVEYGLSGRQIGAAVSWLLANGANILNLGRAVHDWLGGNGQAPSDYDYHGAVEDIRQKVYDLEARQLRASAPLVGFPTDFTQVGEWTFTDCVTVNTAADVYVLQVTVAPRGLAFSQVCGVPMVRRAGWWATLTDTLPGERHYLDFEFNTLTGNGRLPGVVVELGHEGQGTLQAWIRTSP